MPQWDAVVGAVAAKLFRGWWNRRALAAVGRRVTRLRVSEWGWVGQRWSQAGVG
jgi:hypothetical protein